MNLSDDDYDRRSTYFGVYSETQAARLAELLESLGVRYKFTLEDQDEERLRAWKAWDPTVSKPHEGHELYIHDDDLVKVGTRIVEMYPR
jgi:hypothetical protein